MAMKSVTTQVYSCDSLGCDVSAESSGGRPDHWGIVRVYDHKIRSDIIGDQNGWNNYDLCPDHYMRFMSSLGILSHNIPEVPDDIG